MKRWLTIIMLLASCHQPGVQAERQEAIHEVNEKVEKVISELRADCDSNLLQLAKYKADSIRAAQKKKRRR